jgi:hypothetical protein
MGAAPGANESVGVEARRSTMIITPTQVHVTELHRQELLARNTRARIISAAPQLRPSATPKPVGRIRAGPHQAVMSLIAFAPIG